MVFALFCGGFPAALDSSIICFPRCG